jgi:hypothetical protein
VLDRSCPRRYLTDVVPESQARNPTMTAKKRPVRRPLPPMPLSEPPMMKALLTLMAGGATTRHRATEGDPQTRLTTLRLTIIDKLQVLALRRPQSLFIMAQVLDALLDEQLNIPDDQLNSRPTTKARVEM